MNCSVVSSADLSAGTRRASIAEHEYREAALHSATGDRTPNLGAEPIETAEQPAGGGSDQSAPRTTAASAVQRDGTGSTGG